MPRVDSMTGNQLRHWAKQRGLTGTKLAELRGIRQETVSRHMNDRTAMSQEDYQAYAEILEIDVASLVQRSTPTPVFGVLDRDSFVHRRHASQPPLALTFGGPSAIGAVSTAILQPKQMVRTHTHDFSRLDMDDVQMDGCFFVHAASLSAKEVSHNCITRLCMVSAKVDGDHQWMFGYLYPEVEPLPVNSHILANREGAGVSNDRRYTLAPYWPDNISGLMKGLEIEAAAPVLAKVYAPEIVGYDIAEYGT